jgi:hypothetical protein
LSNKMSLVPHNLTILPLFVFKNPFGSYHIYITRDSIKVQTWFLSKFSNSSCMALTQLELERACSISRGSNKATKSVLI